MIGTATAATDIPRERPIITYGLSRDAWESFDSVLRRLIEQHSAIRICEVGGGASPALPLQYLASRGLVYTVLDVSPAELEKAPAGYNKVVADICNPGSDLAGDYDFVFSKMLAEHVGSGEEFHRSIFRLLRPGGVAFHFFPTLYAPPFLLNRLIPSGISSRVLDLILPGARTGRGKFPAFYRWCGGPSEGQIKRLRQVGYEVLEYHGFFGHQYYSKIPVLRDLHGALQRLLVQRPSPYLTSYAYLVLRKPL